LPSNMSISLPGSISRRKPYITSPYLKDLETF
jgi:hypothetical protein